ncbi:D-alanyl-D-alanine carboxypeptidase family protein [Devosia sp. YIM 151766]|uniref:D-alanyl-D-alanine carboxypeptidase family protein n=1 Tax=Devosia sp. YIM 151766 TaxID=3017325 RepID=UPI00255C2C34|nr:D-alanyl-D-alanine carboxypeptidase family protein [Devosia sp. YIM 151766]WIY54237.1 D-alanyl-D-alanine carboxypeptidase family protein [Devosia sp. YIM 151766]
MTFARRLAMALLLTLASFAPAWATPLLLVDRANLEVLYAQDAGQAWHPASLTKLMTAYVVFEELAKGNVTLDTSVTISRKAFNQAPSKSGLAVDSAVSLQDALYILIVKSANDIAVAIAETVGGSEERFVAMMNEVASRMGLTGTHYVNPHGLHDPAQVTTARDLAILSLYIEQTFPQYMPMFSTGVVKLGTAKLESNNGLLEGFVGTTGMKTGYVCASGLNIVATVDRGGRQLLAVVLGGSSGRERNERAAELFVNALSGNTGPTGQTVLTLANAVGSTPTDMRPLICGKESAAYVKAQEAAFPMGLKDQPSYLTDEIVPREHVAVNLGRIRNNIALPRPRPPHVPLFPAAAPTIESANIDEMLRPGLTTIGGMNVPMPRPRPADL